MTAANNDSSTPIAPNFDALVASRRAWIDNVLQPWAVQASRKELRKAEAEWLDIAGRADAEATLWTWAWSRHAELVYEGTTGVNETNEVEVRLKTGEVHRGFPDGRQGTHGQLVLLSTENAESGNEFAGPFNVDDIESVSRC